MFTSSIFAASLLAIASASPAGNYYTPAQSSPAPTTKAVVPTFTPDPVVFNHEVKPVQAIPGLTDAEQAKTDKVKDPQWIQLTFNGGPYLEVYLNKLTYVRLPSTFVNFLPSAPLIVLLHTTIVRNHADIIQLSGNATINNAVNIWSINIAGGTGNYDGTQVNECKVFLDIGGVAPYGRAFGSSDNSYLLGGGHKNEQGQRVEGPGIALRTVLCYAKGTLAVPANSTTTPPTGNTNTTSTCTSA